MIAPAPLVSDSSTYQKPESCETRRDPWPESLVRPLSVRLLDAVTARAIVSVGIIVRHDFAPFELALLRGT